jgi:hypothetical protein
MSEEERRSNLRLNVSYTARLKGFDGDGRRWVEQATIENISPGGLRVRLRRMLKTDAIISVAMRFSTTPVEEPTLRLVARALVVWAEPLADGGCEAAVEFTRRRVF